MILAMAPDHTRTQQVLDLAMQGIPDKEIAHRLHLGESTVRKYVSEAIQANGASNRVDLARRLTERRVRAQLAPRKRKRAGTPGQLEAWA